MAQLIFFNIMSVRKIIADSKENTEKKRKKAMNISKIKTVGIKLTLEIFL